MVRKLFSNENENCMTNMKKKEYIAPECLVVEVEMVNMIAGSVTEGMNPDDDWIGEGGGADMNSNRHRGEWGDLWAGRR